MPPCHAEQVFSAPSAAAQMAFLATATACCDLDLTETSSVLSSRNGTQDKRAMAVSQFLLLKNRGVSQAYSSGEDGTLNRSKSAA